MSDKTIDVFQLRQIQSAYTAGYKKCMEMDGRVKPYVSLNYCYKKYGRKTVDDWADAKLIEILKDGKGRNAKCRVDRERIELVASMCNWTITHDIERNR